MSIVLPDPGPANVHFEQPADPERLARTAEALTGARVRDADRRRRRPRAAAGAGRASGGR